MPNDDKIPQLRINHKIPHKHITVQNGDEQVIVVLYEDGSALIATMVGEDINIVSNRDLVPDPNDPPNGRLFQKRTLAPKVTNKGPSGVQN